MQENEPIDLNKLSQRELLILCASDIRQLKVDSKELREQNQQLAQKQQDQALQINSLETRAKVYGGIGGFITGLAWSLIERFTK